MTRQLTSTELKRLHRDWRRRDDTRVGLLLDGVQSPFNVGSILRLAAAYRVEHLWLASNTASPTSSRTAKTALGTSRYLSWTSFAHAADAAADVRAKGFGLVGIELGTDAVPLHEAALSGPVCLAIGNEDRGLSRDLLALCDQVAFIPQLGRVGSLNVATATAIALYEAHRRTWTGTPPHPIEP